MPPDAADEKQPGHRGRDGARKTASEMLGCRMSPSRFSWNSLFRCSIHKSTTASSSADDKPIALARPSVRTRYKQQTNRVHSPHPLRTAPGGLVAASLVAKGVTKTPDQGYRLENVCSLANDTKFLRTRYRPFG